MLRGAGEGMDEKVVSRYTFRVLGYTLPTEGDRESAMAEKHHEVREPQTIELVQSIPTADESREGRSLGVPEIPSGHRTGAETARAGAARGPVPSETVRRQ